MNIIGQKITDLVDVCMGYKGSVIINSFEIKTENNEFITLFHSTYEPQDVNDLDARMRYLTKIDRDIQEIFEKKLEGKVITAINKNELVVGKSKFQIVM